MSMRLCSLPSVPPGSSNRFRLQPPARKPPTPMSFTKPAASLSLDLDNKWSYLKTHGDVGWEAFPSYLDVFVPRVLRFLEEHRLKITFFIVGQDAAIAGNE